MNSLMKIVLTLATGLFFLVGGLISFRVKDKEKLNNFSGALALVIMSGLIVIDLMPEIIELLEEYKLIVKIAVIIGGALGGFLLLKGLDKFVPHHHHVHQEVNDDLKEHVGHIRHIGTLTIISLILHNIVEGMAIYGVASSDFKIGMLASFGVALHNIPLGTHIFSTMDVKKHKALIGLLTISGALGAILMLCFKAINNLVLGVIIALTLGMMLYIVIMELLKDVLKTRDKMETIIGVIIGEIITIIVLLI